MAYMPLNTMNYAIAIDATSKSVVLSESERQANVIKGVNASTNPVFIATSSSASATIQHPISGTPQNGKTVGAGQPFAFTKSPTDNVVLAIQQVAGVGNLFFSVGTEY